MTTYEQLGLTPREDGQLFAFASDFECWLGQNDKKKAEHLIANVMVIIIHR